MKYPPRLRRSESFLGIHFDFHANENDNQIGKNVTPNMIERIIKQVKPDYIQCDSKGHPGFSSYPTKVGFPALGFTKDQLRIWRDVTAKNGVALYVHHSGVWDTNAIKHYPSWARIDENGMKDKNSTSVFGPYVDKLLIPQLKELCDDYKVDGVWLDGECWATRIDYGRKVINAFKRQTGIDSIPQKPDDPHFMRYLEFCRQGFRDYLNHYVTELHKHNPDFQVCSNWAFSSLMPEPVSIGVDFLSGDFPLMDSVNIARFETRCLVHQGKPWDLMAWGFVCRMEDRPCFSIKSIPQIKQEASIVLSTGGGFQLYFEQKHDGSISQWQMELMKEVAKFCRKRQQYCHKAAPVPQIALLYSGKAFYRKNSKFVFYGEMAGIFAPMRGILQNLLDSQNVVDITMEHQISGRMNDYKLIVLPEWNYLDKEFRKELLEYVKSGGNLLIIGPESATMFKKELGVSFVGKVEQKGKWLRHGSWMAGLKTASQKVKLKKSTEPFGELYDENDHIGAPIPAASIAKYGKGKIAAVYVNLGERYCNARTSVSRDFLNALVRQLFPKPLVEVTGSNYVDVTANRLNGKLMINLINTSGPHGDEDVYVFDEITPVGPLNITIRTGKKPKKVTLQPDNMELKYQFRNRMVRITLSKLEIHDIIVIESI